MKNLTAQSIFLSLLLFFSVACDNSSNQEKNSEKDKSFNPANLQTIEVAVYGMTCEGCERAVQGAVGSLKGVKEVRASHTDSLAIVTYDKTVSSFQDIKTAIDGKGYEAVDYQVSDTISQ